MSDKFMPPRKTVRRRSPSTEPSGESSTDDDANEVERKVPFNVALMRPRPFKQFLEDDSTDSEATDSEATYSEATDSEATDNEENEVARESPKAPRMRVRAREPSDEDDSADSDATSQEELKVSPKKNNDAVNEPPNKKRRLHRRKMYTPRRFISPEAEVNQTDAKPCNSGGSKEGHSD
ncbi:PREDICTED: nucleolin 2-like [Brassica oleracea var. oleracea]|uniref:nucleolin 2-like n=1 Tax=Brassica oleracea var. oleracea TaxID=109376 RepID=UPI0006A716DD|nr:PREDICTED: nucleolin 2-like [Brassica oleracea var. oleracea]